MTRNSLGSSNCLGLHLPGGDSKDWSFGMRALSHFSCFFLILVAVVVNVLAVPCGMWDPGFPTRDWTRVPCRAGLTAGMPGKSFVFHIYCSTFLLKWKSLSCVFVIFVIPWTTVHGILQARRLEWVPFPWTEEPGGYSPWGHKELDTTEWRILFFLSLFLLGISWWSLEDTALLTIWHLLSYFLKQQCSFLIAQGFLSKKSHCPLASLRESDPLKVPLNLINITGQVPLETVLTSPVTQFHQLRQD